MSSAAKKYAKLAEAAQERINKGDARDAKSLLKISTILPDLTANLSEKILKLADSPSISSSVVDVSLPISILELFFRDVLPFSDAQAQEIVQSLFQLAPLISRLITLQQQSSQTSLALRFARCFLVSFLTLKPQAHHQLVDVIADHVLPVLGDSAAGASFIPSLLSSALPILPTLRITDLRRFISICGKLRSATPPSASAPALSPIGDLLLSMICQEQREDRKRSAIELLFCVFPAERDFASSVDGVDSLPSPWSPASSNLMIKSLAHMCEFLKRKKNISSQDTIWQNIVKFLSTKFEFWISEENPDIPHEGQAQVIRAALLLIEKKISEIPGIEPASARQAFASSTAQPTAVEGDRDEVEQLIESVEQLEVDPELLKFFDSFGGSQSLFECLTPKRDLSLVVQLSTLLVLSECQNLSHTIHSTFLQFLDHIKESNFQKISKSETAAQPAVHFHSPAGENHNLKIDSNKTCICILIQRISAKISKNFGDQSENNSDLGIPNFYEPIIDLFFEMRYEKGVSRLQTLSDCGVEIPYSVLKTSISLLIPSTHSAMVTELSVPPDSTIPHISSLLKLVVDTIRKERTDSGTEYVSKDEAQVLMALICPAFEVKFNDRDSFAELAVTFCSLLELLHSDFANPSLSLSPKTQSFGTLQKPKKTSSLYSHLLVPLSLEQTHAKRLLSFLALSQKSEDQRLVEVCCRAVECLNILCDEGVSKVKDVERFLGSIQEYVLPSLWDMFLSPFVRVHPVLVSLFTRFVFMDSDPFKALLFDRFYSESAQARCEAITHSQHYLSALVHVSSDLYPEAALPLRLIVACLCDPDWCVRQAASRALSFLSSPVNQKIVLSHILPFFWKVYCGSGEEIEEEKVVLCQEAEWMARYCGAPLEYLQWSTLIEELGNTTSPHQQKDVSPHDAKTLIPSWKLKVASLRLSMRMLSLRTPISDELLHSLFAAIHSCLCVDGPAGIDFESQHQSLNGDERTQSGGSSEFTKVFFEEMNAIVQSRDSICVESPVILQTLLDMALERLDDFSKTKNENENENDVFREWVNLLSSVFEKFPVDTPPLKSQTLSILSLLLSFLNKNSENNGAPTCIPSFKSGGDQPKSLVALCISVVRECVERSAEMFKIMLPNILKAILPLYHTTQTEPLVSNEIECLIETLLRQQGPSEPPIVLYECLKIRPSDLNIPRSLLISALSHICQKYSQNPHHVLSFCFESLLNTQSDLFAFLFSAPKSTSGSGKSSTKPETQPPDLQQVGVVTSGPIFDSVLWNLTEFVSAACEEPLPPNVVAQVQQFYKKAPWKSVAPSLPFSSQLVLLDLLSVCLLKCNQTETKAFYKSALLPFLSNFTDRPVSTLTHVSSLIHTSSVLSVLKLDEKREWDKTISILIGQFLIGLIKSSGGPGILTPQGKGGQPAVQWNDFGSWEILNYLVEVLLAESSPTPPTLPTLQLPLPNGFSHISDHFSNFFSLLCDLISLRTPISLTNSCNATAAEFPISKSINLSGSESKISETPKLPMLIRAKICVWIVEQCEMIPKLWKTNVFLATEQIVKMDLDKKLQYARLLSSLVSQASISYPKILFSHISEIFGSLIPLLETKQPIVAPVISVAKQKLGGGGDMAPQSPAALSRSSSSGTLTTRSESSLLLNTVLKSAPRLGIATSSSGISTRNLKTIFPSEVRVVLSKNGGCDQPAPWQVYNDLLSAAFACCTCCFVAMADQCVDPMIEHKAWLDICKPVESLVTTDLGVQLSKGARLFVSFVEVLCMSRSSIVSTFGPSWQTMLESLDRQVGGDANITAALQGLSLTPNEAVSFESLKRQICDDCFLL